MSEERSQARREESALEQRRAAAERWERIAAEARARADDFLEHLGEVQRESGRSIRAGVGGCGVPMALRVLLGHYTRSLEQSRAAAEAQLRSPS